MYAKKYFLILIACGFLFACTKHTPAPVRVGGRTQKANLQNLSYRKAKSSKTKYKAPFNGGYVFVQRNDTAYSISKRHNIPLQTFLNANKLKAPYKLHVGQKLIVPKSKYYKVQKGDTLYSISRENDVSLTSLTSMNEIKAPYRISVGQRLILPHASPKKSYSLSTPPKYNQKIPSRSSSKFMKPVNGKIISSFGAKTNGLHNDGINISAKKGTPIKAAENGVVVYSSNKIKGLGNIILIKHEGGWVTTYAHLEKVSVKKGDSVKKGGIIGTVGSTGSVNSPQLHFEIRKKTKPVDPKKYM